MTEQFFSRECPATGQTCIMADCKKACVGLREGDWEKPDFRWLIEAPGPKYLAVQRLTSSTNFEWSADHNKALAFRSEVQADDMMAALRQMDRLHDSYENHGKLSWGKLFAFEPTLGNARAVEHAWASVPLTAGNQTPAPHSPDSQRRGS